MNRLLGGVRPYLILTLLVLAVGLPGIDAVPPFDRDEARFVQATRQMLETGDYVSVYFQDELRAKKPVGIYWLQAAAVEFSGAPRDAVWPYRIPSLLGALIATLLTFYFGRALLGTGVALLGAAFLGSSVMLAAEMHQAKTDAVLLACVVAAQGALGRFYMQPRGGARVGLGTAFVFWLAQGLGMLIKGPILPMVSILTAASVSAADRSTMWMRGLRPIPGIILAAAIVVPWLVAVGQATDGAFVATAVQEDLLPKLLSGQESHGAWPGYYTLLMAAFLWPASLFAWPGLVRAWKARKAAAIRFCLAWIIPAWIVFEIIPTKLPHYVLPAYPAIALLAAAAVLGRDEILKSRGARAYYAVWALLGVALAGAAVALPHVYGDGFSLWSVPAALAAVAAAILPVILAFRQRFTAAAAAAVTAAVVLHASIFQGILPDFERFWVSPRVAEAVARHDTRWPVAAAGYHEPSLVFLLGTETRLAGPAEAAEWLAGRDDALAVVEDRVFGRFLVRLRELGHEPVLLDRVDGFNYSRGQEVTLGIYALARR